MAAKPTAPAATARTAAKARPNCELPVIANHPHHRDSVVIG